MSEGQQLLGWMLFAGAVVAAALIWLDRLTQRWEDEAWQDALAAPPAAAPDGTGEVGNA